jgi:lipopolysaccharide/colanic/teichoic acid biosynthesis glycosyltransferase
MVRSMTQASVFRSDIMQYIDTWSPALDWKILLRTIPRVLTGSGAN